MERNTVSYLLAEVMKYSIIKDRYHSPAASRLKVILAFSIQHSGKVGRKLVYRLKTTGFNISPFVAVIPYPYSFVRNPHEIDEILDIPLASFIDTAHCKQGRARNESEMAIDFRYECNGRIIWGATARIIKQLIESLKSIYGAREQ
jgi:hypothetical protein